MPKKKTIHVILDNYATHKFTNVMAWIAKHPRFVSHLTAMAASWRNAVESLFATLTKRRHLRRFNWTKDPNKISAAVKHGHQVLDSIH